MWLQAHFLEEHSAIQRRTSRHLSIEKHSQSNADGWQQSAFDCNEQVSPRECWPANTKRCVYTTIWDSVVHRLESANRSCKPSSVISLRPRALQAALRWPVLSSGSYDASTGRSEDFSFSAIPLVVNIPVSLILDANVNFKIYLQFFTS